MSHGQSCAVDNCRSKTRQVNHEFCHQCRKDAHGLVQKGEEEAMSEHTPGPWFCENGDNDNQWHVWDDAGIACICDVHAGVEPDPSGATHAHLIAAAPDLLAACEALLAGSSKAAPLARIAIAKAKGEKT